MSRASASLMSKEIICCAMPRPLKLGCVYILVTYARSPDWFIYEGGNG